MTPRQLELDRLQPARLDHEGRGKGGRLDMKKALVAAILLLIANQTFAETPIENDLDSNARALIASA
jgi:hypothetical protein